HSAQALIALICLYSACLLPFGLKLHFEQSKWATIALTYLPLLMIVSGIAKLLLADPARHYQAAPWLYFAVLLLIAIAFAISLYGLKEWTDIDEQIRTAASYLVLSLTGTIEVMLGLLARSILKHRCRLGTLTLIVAGLLSLLAGLGLSASNETWPANW